MSDSFDLLVVGGGINGVGIARDAAGRGLSVLLCERGDLAGATSAASSKLIHGGLRYLEHGEFRLVREALAEREVLLRMAPHLVHPLRLVLPQGPGSRPRWMVRAGLFLYDHLGGAHTLPGTEALDLRRALQGAPLRDGVRFGFAYSDCRTDDARLTIATARDAALRGAEIATRTALVAAQRDAEGWRAELHHANGGTRHVAARVLVNAAGPWVVDLLGRAGIAARAHLRLVKGSHIVVPKLYEHDHAYLLQNDDRRVVFVIPYERDFTLIGTTEMPFDGDPAKAEITAEEIGYLCRAVGRWFRAAPTPQDVVWTFAGVRPLYEDRASNASAVTRDYVFDLDTQGAPALSVFGGKLTTYRRLAEHAMERLAPHLPQAGAPWTANSILPGGDDPLGPQELRRLYPFLDAMTAVRLAEAYGGEARQFLGAARSEADLGAAFGAGFSEAELRWLIGNEWAETADDVLWRRTKLGLRFSAAEQKTLADYFGQRDELLRSPGARGKIAAVLRASQ
ncbi:MAG TPA: glycerol-3-phosphate dehydrogenase [Stellaceae bacterium]|nr:glycerol-3-phosphate dehydrogenase [Stellaceae bacterium]